MRVKVGQRLRSQVDATELIVVKATVDEVDLRCDGAELIEVGQQPTSVPDLGPVPVAPPPKLGKRYTDAGALIELLVTKADTGVLTVAGEPLVERSARPLPASDLWPMPWTPGCRFAAGRVGEPLRAYPDPA